MNTKNTPKASLAPHTLLLLAALALTLSACTTARMALPPGLEAGRAGMPVQGLALADLKGSMAFGPYRMEGIRRGWTASQSWGGNWRFLDYRVRDARQNYEFKLLPSSGPAWDCRCTTQVDQHLLKVMGGEYGELEMELQGRAGYLCAFQPLDGSGYWQVSMTRPSGQTLYSGVLSGPGKRFSVQGTHALAGTSIPLSDPTGYIFSLAGHTVGAVEVINAGAVWLPPALPSNQRHALAATAAALLLYQEISKQ